jgi:hypothetical protein
MQPQQSTRDVDEQDRIVGFLDEVEITRVYEQATAMRPER